MTFTITREPKALNTLVSKAIKAGTTYRKLAHAAMVSTCYHAATSGRCQPLNTFYASLSSNDKTAFRSSYLPRIFAAIGGLDWAEYTDEDGKTLAIPSEILDTAKEAGEWMGYSAKDGFFVHQGKKGQRQKFLKLAEEYLINPDGVVWRPFFDRNNLGEVKTFGNSEFMKAVREAIKKAKGDSDKVDAQVDKKLLAFIEKGFEQAETYVEANEEIEEVTPKAPRTRRVKAEEGVALQ